jgi:2-C-methyl-D-erythritol 4-phosphate cytidylyltransferase
MGEFAVVLPAAGRSTRFAAHPGPGQAPRKPSEKKVFAELEGKAVWLRSVESFVNRPDVGQIVVAISPEDQELFERRYRANVAFFDIQVVLGGAERVETVANALKAVDPGRAFVAIHDAARPCVTAEAIDAVFHAAREHGAAILGVPVNDTIKRVGPDGRIVETVPRSRLVRAQTPQVFRADWLREAFAAWSGDPRSITDDAGLIEALGRPCVVVEGSPENLKITTAADLHLAAAILRSRPEAQPTGPAHPFADESTRTAWDDLPKKKFDELF